MEWKSSSGSVGCGCRSEGSGDGCDCGAGLLRFDLEDDNGFGCSELDSESWLASDLEREKDHVRGFPGTLRPHNRDGKMSKVMNMLFCAIVTARNQPCSTFCLKSPRPKTSQAKLPRPGSSSTISPTQHFHELTTFGLSTALEKRAPFVRV